MNLKHNQRTPKGVITWFEMGQQTMKLKRCIARKMGQQGEMNTYCNHWLHQFLGTSKSMEESRSLKNVVKQKCCFVLCKEQKTTNQRKARQKQMHSANANAVIALTDWVCERFHTLVTMHFKRVQNEFGTSLECVHDVHMSISELHCTLF